MLKTAVFISFLTWISLSFGQVDTSAISSGPDIKPYVHLPKRAAILSAFVPGAGQIYNEFGYRKIANKKHRAWWKVPIIYGGLGACAYYFYNNNKFANLTRQEWLYRNQFEDPEGIVYDQRFAEYDINELIDGAVVDQERVFQGFDKFANRRDIFAFAFLAVWGLNVIEGFVDGHFVRFDVSEDLSLSWHPALIGYRHPGIGLQLNFN